MAERDLDITELPLDSAGARLRRAREQAGLSRADISARTKIAERHLASIEDGNYGAMASRAYAIGFARNYARAIGLDEQEIAASVREDFDGMEPAVDRRPAVTFEPADPARVPTSRLAWLAALGAITAVVIVFILWRSFYAPGASLPDLAAQETPAPVAASALPTPAAPAANSPVVFTAQKDGVWVKFYDAAGNQLLQKELALGESFTIPADANGPMLRTARPDALQVTIGGQVVPAISNRQELVKDVPVSAAALLARGTAGSTPASPAAQAAQATQATQATQAARPAGSAPLATVRVPLAEPRRQPPRPTPAVGQADPVSPAAVVAPAAQPSTVSD